MTNKTIFNFLCNLLIIAFILLFIAGIYSILDLSSSETKILKEGILTKVLIKDKWGGRDLKSNTNFVKYQITINNKKYEFEKKCKCENTQIGDTYYALYLKDNYSENYILFQNKINE